VFRLLVHWFHIPKYTKCTVRLHIRQWSTELQRDPIFKHDEDSNRDSNCEDTRDLVFERDRCSFLESIETCEIQRTKFLAARNLFRLNASTVCPFTINLWFPVFCLYAGLISNSPGQLSCTIAVYIRDWKCYIVHSDGEHEMLRYNWSHWLVTGITTSRYRRPTTNLLYLTVSYTLYTTPLTRHHNALQCL